MGRALKTSALGSHQIDTESVLCQQKKMLLWANRYRVFGFPSFSTGVSIGPKKVESVVNWPVPKIVKGVWGFLGLTRYYRKFVRDYGKIAHPLTDLLKKDGFKWNSEAQDSFDTLRRILTNAPVLRLPDFTKDFVIECDASRRGLGTILMQEGQPVAYYSKALS